MAAIALYVGYGLLTSPLWLPLTIGIWLSAAVMVAIAVMAPAEVRANSGPLLHFTLASALARIADEAEAAAS